LAVRLPDCPEPRTDRRRSEANEADGGLLAGSSPPFPPQADKATGAPASGMSRFKPDLRPLDVMRMHPPLVSI